MTLYERINFSFAGINMPIDINNVVKVEIFEQFFYKNYLLIEVGDINEWPMYDSLLYNNEDYDIFYYNKNIIVYQERANKQKNSDYDLIINNIDFFNRQQPINVINNNQIVLFKKNYPYNISPLPIFRVEINITLRNEFTKIINSVCHTNILISTQQMYNIQTNLLNLPEQIIIHNIIRGPFQNQNIQGLTINYSYHFNSVLEEKQTIIFNSQFAKINKYDLFLSGEIYQNHINSMRLFSQFNPNNLHPFFDNIKNFLKFTHKIKIIIQENQNLTMNNLFEIDINNNTYILYPVEIIRSYTSIHGGLMEIMGYLLLQQQAQLLLAPQNIHVFPIFPLNNLNTYNIRNILRIFRRSLRFMLNNNRIYLNISNNSSNFILQKERPIITIN